MKISLRLKTIASLVESNAKTLDIGCDHALLDIYLVKENIIKSAIASDLRQGALRQAKKNVNKYNLESKIKLIISDGFDNVSSSEYNTVIISGLGTNKILELVKRDIKKLPKTMIIQSNNNIFELRKEICKLGYKIIDEKLVFDANIYYVIIKFKQGKEKYNYKDYKFGPILRTNKNHTYLNYINFLILSNYNINKNLNIKHMFLKLKVLNNIYKLKQEANKCN